MACRTQSKSLIRVASGETVSKTRYGIHRTHYNVTRGWGELINGWGIELHADLRDKSMYIDLGFDESSVEFKRILDNAYTFNRRSSAGYLQRTMRFAGRNEGTRPYKTESIAATMLLRQLIAPDEHVLGQPELVVPLMVISADHSPSLSSVKFVESRKELTTLVGA